MAPFLMMVIRVLDLLLENPAKPHADAASSGNGKFMDVFLVALCVSEAQVSSRPSVSITLGGGRRNESARSPVNRRSRFPGTDPFRERLQLSQLEYVAHSSAAAKSLAENYVGLPLDWGEA